ncbi:response regulator [Sphingomonas sp. AOB5]|uniref:response regulator transcription factor n=1 Tax=Sphingomonas sp. AOB5 TaxID=3034017 RepID=UPI0023F7B12B|nr:response regulator [Sphingomonas sp. AOB5]MDF7777629.1 response regulator [Sphingomonas sp. AOB5]
MRFIYIVDDDRISREVIRLTLDRDSNTLVRTFESGLDFIQEVDELDPGVLLLDLNMPTLGGAEVLAALKARGDEKFVTLLVSATNSVPLTVQAMKQGAVDLISKPVEHDTLADALVRAFDRLDANNATAAAARDARQRIARLSPRELDVLRHLFDGCANKVTARALGIGARTVEIYRAAMMRKLGVHDLAHAVRLAIVAGWVADDKDDRVAG